MNERNKSKIGARKLAGVIIAAMIVASLAGIFAHAFGREVPIPDGEKGIYFLDPKNSSASENCNVTIDIWVNTSLTGDYPVMDYLLSGKVTLEIGDKACANITSCEINATEWPFNPVARILEGGKKAQMTYSVYMGAPGKPPGIYNVGTITVHCNSSTYCITNLSFVSPTYIANLSTYHIPGENGTFTCKIEMPAPNITSSAPSSPVTDYSGATRTFNITIDQPVNVSWLINGTVVKDSEKGVTEASYTNTSAVVGTWNVSAVVENANGTEMQTWIWNVMEPPVLVNEFVSNNATEWIELYNKKDYAISLTGWTIEDNTGTSASLDGKIIAANGYLVLTKATDFSFTLNNDDDIIILKNGSLEVDKVAYGNYNDGNTADNAPAPGAGKSAGRCPNGVDTNNDSADFRVFDVPTKGAPNTIYPEIIGFAPHTHVSDNEGATRTFNITVDQPVDVTWRINGTQVQTNASVPACTSCSYTNTSAVAGYWEVTATASNENGSVTQTWWWTVNDTTPPTVTDWAPTGTGAAITTNITATFSEPMNESTLNDETIIVENSTGSAIAGAVTYDSATRTVTFDPTANLEYNETYNVTITTGVADLAGNHLAAHKTWNFTTRSEVMEATISIGNASTNTGYTTVVPIRIDNATNLGSVDINLTYNSSVVIAVNVTGGDFDVTIPNLEHNVSGLVRIGAFQTENPGLNGSVNLAWVKLKAVGNTGENSPLNISVNTLRDATPQCNLIPYQVSNGTFTILLNGDVNGDGVVDIADAMYLAKHVLGITGFELIIEEAADVNGDDEIDLADAMYLAKYVLGIEGFEELK